MSNPSTSTPSAYASEHKGRSRKGNDGSMYRSEPDKNGVYQWKKSGAKVVSPLAARRPASKARRAPTT